MTCFYARKELMKSPNKEKPTRTDKNDGLRDGK